MRDGLIVTENPDAIRVITVVTDESPPVPRLNIYPGTSNDWPDDEGREKNDRKKPLKLGSFHKVVIQI